MASNALGFKLSAPRKRSIANCNKLILFWVLKAGFENVAKI